MFRIQPQPPAAFIGEQEVELLHYSDQLESEVRVPIRLLKALQIRDYLPLLICDLVLDADFAIAEAKGCRLYRGHADEDIDLYISFGDKHGVWRNDIAVGAAYREMSQLPNIEAFERDLDIEFDDLDLFVSKKLKPDSEENLFDVVASFLLQVRQLVELVNDRLFGFHWKDEYEKDEPLFTKEVVIPVLRKLGFGSVRYNHGVNEFGRDVLFSELDKFGRIRHCAAQVKAGDIAASNGVLLGTLLTQIDDAFAMPVMGPGKSKQFNISEVLVICSGRITEGAVQRLNQKLDPRLVGSVHFLDRDDIEYFAKAFWPLA